MNARYILIILHLDRIAKAIVFRCSYTERLSLLSFANSNSRSIIKAYNITKYLNILKSPITIIN